MSIPVKLRNRYKYQPHYSFFNYVRKAVGEYLAEGYIDKDLISSLESAGTFFIKMHLSKADSPNVERWIEDGLYTLKFFDDSRSSHTYYQFMELPMTDYKRSRLILPESKSIFIAEHKNYLREEEVAHQCIGVLYEGDRCLLKSFQSKEEAIKHLKEFGNIIPKDGLSWISRSMSFFSSYRYTPDCIYLEYEKQGSERISIDLLSEPPNFISRAESSGSISHELASYKRIGGFDVEIPIVIPKAIHAFEVKTTDPQVLGSYTPNQKKAIHALLHDDKIKSIKMHIIYIPMRNFIPLKGAFEVLVYDV